MSRITLAPRLDGRALLARLTDVEYVAIVAAAASDVRLARWIEDLRMAGSLRVADAAVVAARDALVAAELLTKARADLIFAP
jgi:type II secretory pathway component PulM